MRYLLVTLAILTCSAEADMSQNLGTVNANVLGKLLNIPAGTQAGSLLPVLRLELTVPQPLQVTLNSFPSTDNFGLQGVNIKGGWVIRWGTGGAALQNLMLVDGNPATTIPIHAAFVSIDFVPSETVLTKGSVIASVGGGSHNTSKISLSSGFTTPVAAADVFTSFIPPYARRVQLQRSNSAQDVTAYELVGLIGGVSTVLSSNVWPASAPPFTIDIPNGATTLRATNNGAAPMLIGAVFDLGV